MLTLPSDVEPILARSHGVSARLFASVNGSGFTYPVALRDGQVGVSLSSPVRRTLSATIAADITDPECDVFGTELRAEYGVMRVNGTIHWVAVGTFVVTAAEEAGRGIVRVTGEDRWRLVTNARLLAPVTTSGGTVDAITSLLTGADGRITVVDETGSAATHQRSLWERDRDKAILDLAKSIGAVVAFDPSGVARIRKAPLPTDAVNLRLYGGDGGLLVESRRGAEQGNTYNAVVVQGETSDGARPVRAVRTVASGVLRYGGPFGRRPRFYTSPLIRTQAQADGAADALIARVTGTARTVTVDSAPHPGLDAGDVIAVEVSPGVYERHVVDGFSLPLGMGAVSIDTRTTEAPGE